MSTSPVIRCPLCDFDNAHFFWHGGKASHDRDFYLCDRCDLVFVPERFFISREDEKEAYLQHNNEIYDPAYRRFLSNLYNEIKPHLKPDSSGLDFGAGPGPALAHMMKEDGYDVQMYDPFFSASAKPLEDTYDFVTCTETLEHLREPRRDLDRLNSLLKSPGWLRVMTGMLDDRAEFPSWYYHRNPTHVCFYSRVTMKWIAQKYLWSVYFPAANVTLFHKS